MSTVLNLLLCAVCIGVIAVGVLVFTLLRKYAPPYMIALIRNQQLQVRLTDAQFDNDDPMSIQPDDAEPMTFQSEYEIPQSAYEDVFKEMARTKASDAHRVEGWSGGMEFGIEPHEEAAQ